MFAQFGTLPARLLTPSPPRHTMKDWLQSSTKRKAVKQSPKVNGLPSTKLPGVIRSLLNHGYTSEAILSLTTYDQPCSSDSSNSGMKTELEQSTTPTPATIVHEMATNPGYSMNNVCSGYIEFSFGPFRLIPEQQLLLED